MTDNSSPKYGLHSLRFKLVAGSVLVQVIMLSILVWNSTRLANEHLIQQAEQHIQEILPLLNSSVAGPLLQEDIASLGEILDRAINNRELSYVAIFNAEGKLFIKRGLSSNTNDGNNISLQQHMSNDNASTPYHLNAPITLADTAIGYLELEFDTLPILKAIQSTSQQGISIAITAILLSILLLAFLGFTITRSLLTLTRAVSSLSPTGLSPAGEGLDINISNKDEVGGLALAFKRLTHKLKQREEERDAAARATQESDARYRRLVENLSSEYFFYSHDTDGMFFFVSESVTDVLGYSQKDFLSHYSTYLTDNPINEKLKSRGKDYPPGKKHRAPFIISIYHRDGSERMLEVSESPVLDSNGRVSAMEGIAHDITRRLREAEELRQHRDNLEAMVVERTIELETSNSELESFCYSVSHDLRAPLRGINGFGTALLEDYESVLDDTGKHYLSRITNGTERMSELIDDLLNLSRITRHKMDIQSLDISKMAREITRSLKEAEPNRSVTVNIEEGMHAKGDHNLLMIALANLIGNAWKYTMKRDDALINVQASAKNGKRIFSIADNGAGFNPAYVDKIFLPFQRLHSADEFPGNGVGLSTVHRVISRHQGEIWTQANIGEGATFYFTLGIH